MTDSLPEPKFERRAIVGGMTDGIRLEVKEGIDSTAVLRGDKVK